MENGERSQSMIKTLVDKQIKVYRNAGKDWISFDQNPVPAGQRDGPFFYDRNKILSYWRENEAKDLSIEPNGKKVDVVTKRGITIATFIYEPRWGWYREE